MTTRHPGDGEWADLARGLCSPPDATRLLAHAARCESCRDALETVRAVTELGAREASWTPAAAVVRQAEAIFAPRPRVRESAWPTLAALLTFDSWHEPALAGVRAQAAAERHVTYRAGDWEIDLRLEGSGRQGLAVLGQVAHSKDSTVPLDGVPVTLRAGRRALATTTLNAFGEFQIECAAVGENLRVSIPVTSSGVRLDIPVPPAVRGDR